MGQLNKILLTGASGFLGSHLLKSLIKHGYKPLVYLRPGSDTWRIKHLQDNFELFIAADNSEQQIEELFAKHSISTVIHTATEYGRGKSLASVLETNVLFPLRLLEAGIKKGITLFINTDSFFGKKQFTLKYLNNYTTSKRMLEGVLPEFSNQTKIVNMRLEHVYGENDSETKFVTAVLKNCLTNSTEMALTAGIQKRDFVYVDDVVQSYITILKNEHNLSGYNEFEVGTGQSVMVKDFVNSIGELSGAKTLLNFGVIPVREGEIEDSFADNHLLKKLGWTPEFDIKKAIEKIILTEKKRFINEI